MKPHARLLVVHCDNPRHFGGENAYAHPRAIGAELKDKSTHPYTWGDIEIMPWHDRDTAIPIDRFLLGSQVDDRTDGGHPYAVTYGYDLNNRDGIITSEAIAKYGKPLAAINRSLDKARERDGSVPSFGVLILRLARALKVDAIVLMPSRPWDYSTDTHLVFAMTGKPGDAVWHIDQMVRRAHEACCKMTGKQPVEA